MTRILYRGGTVYAPMPGATALVTDGARIAWVGSGDAAGGIGAAEVDRVVELDGAWVAPAFVDAHVHVIAAGLAMSRLDLANARSLSDVLDAVQSLAATAPGDALIWGTGWDETQWAAGPRRAPTPVELARAAGDRFVYLARVDVHSAAGSPALLRLAGLPVADLPVRGEAHHRLRATVGRSLSVHQRFAAAATFFAAAARLGVGMVHECAGPHIGDPTDLAIVRQAAADAGVGLVAYWGEAGAEGVARARQWGAEPAGDVFVDGSIGSRTAALSSTYLDDEAAGCGELQLAPDEIAGHLIAATRAGAQAGFHAIGDAAITAVVEALVRAEAAVGITALVAARHRLEHLEMCGANHRLALSRYGVVASVQPAFAARWGGATGMYAKRLGSSRAEAMNDFAALAAAGIPLAFGSDAPVTPLDPWGALRAASRTPATNRRMSARAAFAAHTRGGYRAARQDEGGVLRPGADATFAIWQDVGELTVNTPDRRIAGWSTDPRSGAPGLPDLDRPAPHCVATMVRGVAARDERGLHVDR